MILVPFVMLVVDVRVIFFSSKLPFIFLPLSPTLSSPPPPPLSLSLFFVTYSMLAQLHCNKAGTPGDTTLCSLSFVTICTSTSSGGFRPLNVYVALTGGNHGIAIQPIHPLCPCWHHSPDAIAPLWATSTHFITNSTSSSQQLGIVL